MPKQSDMVFQCSLREMIIVIIINIIIIMSIIIIIIIITIIITARGIYPLVIR